MKKVLLGSIGLLALSVTTRASGADLAARPYTKAPPVIVQPVSDWTGWYVGVNLGYGIGRDASTDTAVSGAGFPILAPGTTLYGGTKFFDVSSRGVIGGGQLGYNWQTSTNIVLGVEADIQASDITGRSGCIVTCGTGVVTAPVGVLPFFPVVFTDDTVRHRIDWFGTVRGRLGYSTGPSLFYVTGGLAYGDVQRSGRVVGTTIFTPVPGAIVNSFAGSYNVSSVRAGWTIGAGLESKIWNNWSVKAEYLYVDLGSNTDSFNTLFTTAGGGAVVGAVAATRTDTSTNRDHVFRVGLNYRFNPAVVAKY